MSTLAITATFPLGTFLGHRPDGRGAPLPDTNRLVSALIHAAGKGGTAIEVNGDLRPSEPAKEAIRWLEAHPPSALEVPEHQHSSATGAMAWRPSGTMSKKGSRLVGRKEAKRQTSGTAMAGRFGWAWEDDVPGTVVETLDALCADVSCLGEADSPVVLEVGAVAPTHFMDPTATAFSRGAMLKVAAPLTGRFDELETDYVQQRPKRRPTAAADRRRDTEEPRAIKPTRARVREVAYRPVAAPLPDLPWNLGWALPTPRPIGPHERVRWAVALHRAMVSRLGDDAPPLVTGRYPEGQKRPANRVMVGYVHGPTVDESLREGAFVVLAPSGGDLADIEQAESALQALRRVYLDRSTELSIENIHPIDPERFWLEPLPGVVRTWVPDVPLVPETRRPRSQPDWSWAEAALLSVGHVFRDRLDLGRLRGDDRYVETVRQVRGWGVEVLSVSRVADSRVERYAHRLPRHLVAQPYRARLDLSSLVGQESLVALGQARHLGGGLLVPHDSPAHVTGDL